MWRMRAGTQRLHLFAPHSAEKVLCITEEGIVETLGPAIPGEGKYLGGVLEPNACICLGRSENSQQGIANRDYMGLFNSFSSI